MKIIHLILGRANPNRMNGVNKVVHNLATVQSQKGYTIEVWGITSSYLKEDEFKDRNYDSIIVVICDF